MRVLIVALALVATPFVAGVAQGRGHDAAHCARRADQHPGKDINKCPAPAPAPAPAPVPDPVPPPPVSSCTVVPPPASSETGRITGTVADGATWVPLDGWCVHLTGLVSATALTSGSGSFNFSFGSLPAGTYTVCEDVQAGWRVTWPGAGINCFTTDVAAGSWSAGWFFGNVTP